jgi:phospholipid transport system substrate-binding protein
MEVTDIKRMEGAFMQLSHQNRNVWRRQRARFAAFASLASVALIAAAAADTVSRGDTAPDALMRSISTEVLDSIKADPSLRGGDFVKRQVLIDEKVAPYVDFDRMTRLSVGPGWRTATPEQRQALTDEFRTYVILTYSGAMSRVTDEQVKVQPMEAPLSATEVIVRTQLASSKGEPTQLDYRLERSATGWKIYDVAILGVSMVETFKDSFASEISRNGVAGLIRALTDKNRQLMASRS